MFLEISSKNRSSCCWLETTPPWFHSDPSWSLVQLETRVASSPQFPGHPLPLAPGGSGAKSPCFVVKEDMETPLKDGTLTSGKICIRKSECQQIELSSIKFCLKVFPFN